MDERFPRYKRRDGVEQWLVPKPRCELCYLPIQASYATSTGQCFGCYNGSKIDGEILQRVLAAALYVPRATGVPHNHEIIGLKDSGRFAAQYAEVLCWVLKSEGIEFGAGSVLVPVLQTTPRELTSGPVALSNALSDECGVPSLRALSHLRKVESQKGLSRTERERNIENSMTSDRSVAGRAVFLVDDILTTGNTMHEAARAVRSAGAVSVIGLVAGRDASLESLYYAGVLRRVEN